MLTSAGTVAGIGCCLHVLRTDFGAEVANRVARRLVVAPHRQGGQAQFIEHPLPASDADVRLSAVLDWASRHLAEELPIDRLAERAVMSRRTFTRHFRQATGTTVGPWLLSQRLALVQRLLETTDYTIDRIATDAGLGTGASLRQHFVAAFKTSPSMHRRQFRDSGQRAYEPHNWTSVDAPALAMAPVRVPRRTLACPGQVLRRQRLRSRDDTEAVVLGVSSVLRSDVGLPPVFCAEGIASGPVVSGAGSMPGYFLAKPAWPRDERWATKSPAG